MMSLFKKLLAWLRNIWRWFHRDRRVEEADLIQKIPGLKWGKWIQGVQRLLLGPNMPKYQPCSLNHGWKKRVEKAQTGAYYGCNRCKALFLVPYRGVR